MHPAINALKRAPYYDAYLSLIKSNDLDAELLHSQEALIKVIAPLNESKLDFRYASGKWSIREVVMHLIDTEMVFNYRALTIARETDAQTLKGFDENIYVNHCQSAALSGKELCAFFEATRTSTRYLARTFSPEQLIKTGMANDNVVSVAALLFINAGHAMHHANVITQRYLAPGLL